METTKSPSNTTQFKKVQSKFYYQQVAPIYYTMRQKKLHRNHQQVTEQDWTMKFLEHANCKPEMYFCYFFN